MSRNIGATTCYFCDGPVVHEEPARRITQEEAGVYFDEYDGMLVANAHCRDCEAQYLAWCRGRPDWYIGHTAYRNDAGPGLHNDLSFRSTFNDEPGEEDKARYDIVTVRYRKGADGTLTPIPGATRE